MTWKVSRYQQTNNLLEPTVMTVIIDNGLDRIQKDLEGDHREDTDEALIKQVLDKFYDQYFPNRAENEKFHQVDTKLAEMDSAIAESRQATIENRQRVDLAVAELTELITGFMAMLGGDGLVTEEIDGDVVDTIESEVEINEVE